jgi:hypothetical protein
VIIDESIGLSDCVKSALETALGQDEVARHHVIRFFLLLGELHMGWPFVWDDRVRASSGGHNISEIPHDGSLTFCL